MQKSMTYTKREDKAGAKLHLVIRKPDEYD